MNEVFQKDLKRLNRDYLRLAREIGNVNPSQALMVLGMPSSVLRVITSLSLDEIETVAAQPHALQYTVRFSEAYWRQVQEAAQGNGEPSLIRLITAAHTAGEGSSA